MRLLTRYTAIANTITAVSLWFSIISSATLGKPYINSLVQQIDDGFSHEATVAELIGILRCFVD